MARKAPTLHGIKSFIHKAILVVIAAKPSLMTKLTIYLLRYTEFFR